MDEWSGLYKLARLGVLAFTLLAIAIYLYWPSRRERLEAPARRMLEDTDE
jgi:cbb3-type cytochrome oxidase subunit 3